MADKIVVDTLMLDQYTTRIRNVLVRIDDLYPSVKQLYYTGEVKGLWYLYNRNRFYNGRQTVANCRTSINKTIAELNRVEEYLSNVDPLRFQAPSTSLITVEARNDQNAANAKLKEIISRYFWQTLVSTTAIWLAVVKSTGARDSTKSTTDKTKEGIITSLFKNIGDLGSKIGSVTKKDGAKAVGKSIKAVGTVLSTITGKHEDGADLAADFSGMTGSLADLWKSYYEYYEKKLPAKDAKSLYDKFGGWAKWAGVASDGGSFLKDAINAIRESKTSDWSHNLSNLVGCISSGGKTVGNLYLIEEYGNKVLTVKVKNQILDKPANMELLAEDADKLKKGKTLLDWVEIVTSGVQSGIIQYQKSTKDGSFTFKDDGAEMVVATSVGSLAQIVSILTKGIVSYDAEEVTDYLLTDASNAVLAHIEKSENLSNYIHDEENPYIIKLAATIGAMVDTAGESLYGKSEYWSNYMSSTDNTLLNNIATRTVVTTGSAVAVGVGKVGSKALETAKNVGQAIVDGATALGELDKQVYDYVTQQLRHLF